MDKGSKILNVVFSMLIAVVIIQAMVSMGMINIDAVKKQVEHVLFHPNHKPVANWPTWKTIKLGMSGFKTADDFRKDLNNKRMYIIAGYNDEIINKPQFKVSSKETEINLVAVSTAELGLRGTVGLKEIYNRAQECGLQLCPPEVGPQLRLQYTNQPIGEYLLIAMEPIATSNGFLKLFGVGRPKDYPWLIDCHCGHRNLFWDKGPRFVFVLPRSKAPFLHRASGALFLFNLSY